MPQNRVFRGASPEYQNTRTPEYHTCPKRYSEFFAQKRHLPQRTGNSPVPPGVAGKLGLFVPPARAGRGDRPEALPNPQSAIRNRGIGFVSHGGSIAASYFKHRTSHFKPPIRLPLPMLRVARVVTEFCARARPESRVTPCAGGNKEFPARGVFYLLNCCTNANEEHWNHG